MLAVAYLWGALGTILMLGCMLYELNVMNLQTAPEASPVLRILTMILLSGTTVLSMWVLFLQSWAAALLFVLVLACYFFALFSLFQGAVRLVSYMVRR
ncbi:MAG: hypothetical protein WCY07_03040 [Pigmentiphaga sp.]